MSYKAEKTPLSELKKKEAVESSIITGKALGKEHVVALVFWGLAQ